MTTPVQVFLEKYATALTSYSAKEIAEFYQTPLAVCSDKGVLLVSEMAEVVSFWKEGIKPYQTQGIQKAKPRILNEEKLSETIYVSKVSWSNFDQADQKVGEEINFYILTDNGGELRISGLVII